MKVSSLDAVARPTEEETPAAAATVVAREAEFEEKARKAPGRIRRQLEQLRLFMRMLKEVRRGEYPRLPWLTVASLAGALLYFLNPFDLVPDFILGVGLLDDASVAALVVKAFQSDLMAFCEARGLDRSLYFGDD